MMHTSRNYPLITLQTSNRAHKLPRQSDLADAISDSVRLILEELDLGRNADKCEMSVTVTTDQEIRLINAEHRRIGKATDTLSFPVLEPGELKKKPKKDGPPIMIGDIVLSTDTIRAQAEDRDLAFEERFAECFVHGVLHLLGWQHGEDEERKKMESMEDRLVPKVLEILSS